MTEHDLYNIASKKPLLTDEELKNQLTNNDIESMTEEAWKMHLQLMESNSNKKRNRYMKK